MLRQMSNSWGELSHLECLGRREIQASGPFPVQYLFPCKTSLFVCLKFSHTSRGIKDLKSQTNTETSPIRTSILPTLTPRWLRIQSSIVPAARSTTNRYRHMSHSPA